MFIAPNGKQPLEKKWRVKGSPTTHEIVLPELLVELLLVDSIFIVIGGLEELLTIKWL